MRTQQQLNRISGMALVLLSVTALGVVLWGYTQPPLSDEGTGAHIFQLAIVMLVPVTLFFLATADWSRPSRTGWPLAIALTATALAFAGLYYLEHVYYSGAERRQARPGETCSHAARARINQQMTALVAKPRAIPKAPTTTPIAVGDMALAA